MRSFRYISVFAEETFALIWDDEIFELNKQMAQAIKDNNQQNQEQLENKMIEIIKTDIIKFKFAERELFPIATEFFKLLTC